MGTKDPGISDVSGPDTNGDIECRGPVKHQSALPECEEQDTDNGACTDGPGIEDVSGLTPNTCPEGPIAMMEGPKAITCPEGPIAMMEGHKAVCQGDHSHATKGWHRLGAECFHLLCRSEAMLPIAPATLKVDQGSGNAMGKTPHRQNMKKLPRTESALQK